MKSAMFITGEGFSNWKCGGGDFSKHLTNIQSTSLNKSYFNDNITSFSILLFSKCICVDVLRWTRSYVNANLRKSKVHFYFSLRQIKPNLQAWRLVARTEDLQRIKKKILENGRKRALKGPKIKISKNGKKPFFP